MKAKFELEYTGRSSMDVFVQIDLDVETDTGKLNFITAVADMLGVSDRVLVKAPLAEEMWENHDGNEAHE